MKFLRRLKAAWLYGKYAPYIEEADAADFWSPSDERWLATMLDSYSGQKLRHRLTNYTIKSAMFAVRTTGVNHEYQSGIAAGIAMGISAIDEHLPYAATIRSTSEASSDDAALDALETEAAA